MKGISYLAPRIDGPGTSPNQQQKTPCFRPPGPAHLAHLPQLPQEVHRGPEPVEAEDAQVGEDGQVRHHTPVLQGLSGGWVNQMEGRGALEGY